MAPSIPYSPPNGMTRTPHPQGTGDASAGTGYAPTHGSQGAAQNATTRGPGFHHPSWSYEHHSRLIYGEQYSAPQNDRQNARATEGSSPTQAAAREAPTGHQYSNVVIKGKAQTGDTYSDDWKHGARSSSHSYGKVEVDMNGKALLGNKYGGRDFWDE